MTDLMPEEALHGEVLFDEKKVPVPGVVRRANLGRFPPKVVTGDYSKDSDDLLSTWVLARFDGGGQVEDIEEGAHEGRFWYSTLNTQSPNKLALAPMTYTVIGPNTDGARPLGDLNNNFYAAYGTAVRLVAGTPAVASGAWTALTAAPVGKARAFQGTATKQLYIPMGASGYARFDGTTLTNVAASGTQPAALAFEVWDNKLHALATNGGIWTSTDGSSWTLILTLDGSYTPRHLIGYYNREAAETLHVVTASHVWAIDPDVTPQKLVNTGLRFPPHPSHGLGAAVWEYRLYVSRGLGVELYDGNIQTPMGPNRNDGLPFAYRGKVLDLCAGEQLFALIEGAATVGTGTDTIDMDEGPPESGIYVGETTTNGSLMAWTGRGWHTLWASVTATGNATWATVSATTAAHRVVWGYGGNLYYIDLTTDNANPAQLSRAGLGDFAASGYLETGDFDANMVAFTKLGSLFKVKATVMPPGGSITALYSLDLGQTWQTLGQVTTTTETNFPLGEIVNDHSRGIAFKHIRLRIEFVRGDTTTISPIMEYAALEFKKVPKASYSWAFRVPLEDMRGYSNEDLEEIGDYIETLVGETDADGNAISPRFFVFGHRGRRFRASVAQVTAEEPTGDITAGRFMDVTVVGVPAA